MGEKERGREKERERERRGVREREGKVIYYSALQSACSDKAPLQEKSTQYRCVMMCTLNF